METFSPCGLILVVFEFNTHVFALTPNRHRIYRVSPPPDSPEPLLEQDTVKAILDDCSKAAESGAKMLKEQLLWCLVGSSADVFSNFLQNVRGRPCDGQHILFKAFALTGP